MARRLPVEKKGHCDFCNYDDVPLIDGTCGEPGCSKIKCRECANGTSSPNCLPHSPPGTTIPAKPKPIIVSAKLFKTAAELKAEFQASMDARQALRKLSDAGSAIVNSAATVPAPEKKKCDGSCMPKCGVCLDAPKSGKDAKEPEPVVPAVPASIPASIPAPSLIPASIQDGFAVSQNDVITLAAIPVVSASDIEDLLRGKSVQNLRNVIDQVEAKERDGFALNLNDLLTSRYASNQLAVQTAALASASPVARVARVARGAAMISLPAMWTIFGDELDKTTRMLMDNKVRDPILRELLDGFQKTLDKVAASLVDGKESEKKQKSIAFFDTIGNAALNALFSRAAINDGEYTCRQCTTPAKQLDDFMAVQRDGRCVNGCKEKQQWKEGAEKMMSDYEALKISGAELQNTFNEIDKKSTPAMTSAFGDIFTEERLAKALANEQAAADARDQQLMELKKKQETSRELVVAMRKETKELVITKTEGIVERRKAIRELNMKIMDDLATEVHGNALTTADIKSWKAKHLADVGEASAHIFDELPARFDEKVLAQQMQRCETMDNSKWTALNSKGLFLEWLKANSPKDYEPACTKFGKHQSAQAEHVAVINRKRPYFFPTCSEKKIKYKLKLLQVDYAAKRLIKRLDELGEPKHYYAPLDPNEVLALSARNTPGNKRPLEEPANPNPPKKVKAGAGAGAGAGSGSAVKKKTAQKELAALMS